jgi:hypothetical protein
MAEVMGRLVFIISKPTLCYVNVAQLAISRDLGLDFNSYSTKISAN